MKFPKWTEPYLFAVILSGMMSFLVSGIATVKALGFTDDFLVQWCTAWLGAWPVAACAVLVLGPFVRRLVPKLLAE